MAVATLASLDAAALRAGALVAGAIAVPAGVVAQILDDADAATGVIFAFGLAIWVGLVLGAGTAARRQRAGTPLTHGIVTSVGAFVVIQAVGVIRRTVTGDDITWSRIVSNLAVSLLAGLVGGMIGSRLRERDRLESP